MKMEIKRSLLKIITNRLCQEKAGFSVCVTYVTVAN